MHTFEEVTPGETLEFGSYEVTREEIIEFAEQYDPQSFHLGDDHHAPYETVIASGWHTAAMTMRMLVDGYLVDAETLGSPGLDGLEWRRPVTPGDTLSVRLTLGEKEVWDEDRGMVKQEIETINGDGEVVLWMDARCLYARTTDD
jgi:acyl dehydratase